MAAGPPRRHARVGRKRRGQPRQPPRRGRLAGLRPRRGGDRCAPVTWYRPVRWCPRVPVASEAGSSERATTPAESAGHLRRPGDGTRRRRRLGGHARPLRRGRRIPLLPLGRARHPRRHRRVHRGHFVGDREGRRSGPRRGGHRPHPAEPPLIIRDTGRCLVSAHGTGAITASAEEMVGRVQAHVPGYRSSNRRTTRSRATTGCARCRRRARPPPTR